MTQRPGTGIAVIGRANIDLTIRVPFMPTAGRAAFGSTLNTTAGGKSLNQAVAIAKLGGRACLVSRAGADSWGRQLRATVIDAGVDVTHFHLISEATTAAAIIQVTPDGESYISLALSPATELTADAVTEALDLEEPAIVVTQLDLPPDPVRAAIQRAQRGLLIGNLVPHPDFDRQLLSELDVLVVNEHEADDILGTHGVDPSDTLREIQRLGPKAVVVTAGSGGAYYSDGHKFGHVAAETVNVVDTSGAGDAFIGALAVQLSRHGDLAAAAAVANSVAAIAVQQPGSLLSIGTSAGLAGAGHIPTSP